MSSMRSRLVKRVALLAGATAALAVAAAGALYALIEWASLPLADGASLSSGAVRVVVTDRWGPIRIAAYIVALDDGGVALVDTGMDPEADALLAALAADGRSADDVRAIFFTHFHNDHRAGALAFPRADYYVPARYVELIRARRKPAAGAAVHGFVGGDRLTVGGSVVEVFDLPGHTDDSVAVFARGVLFLGDSAASTRDGRLHPNTMLADDPEGTVASLAALAARLAPRREEVHHIAFGHQGPLDGLAPLLDWAAGRAAEQPAQ